MHDYGEQEMSGSKTRRRKVHVDLPETIHQRLRVKAALLDMSMQAFVADVVSKAVADVVLPTMKAGKRTS
jgi:plasmid stability protein